MPSNKKPIKEKSRTKKNTLLWVLLGLLVATLVGFLIFYLVQQSRIKKAEADSASAGAASFKEQAEGISSKAPEDLSSPWWQNPSNVAIYVADWCGKGHPREMTSKGCRYVQDLPGENKISPEDWEIKLASLAESAGVGLGATATERIATAVRTAMDSRITFTTNRFGNRFLNGEGITMDREHKNLTNSELKTAYLDGLKDVAKTELQGVHSYQQGRSFCNTKINLPKESKFDFRDAHSGIWWLTSSTSSDSKSMISKDIWNPFYSAIRDSLRPQDFVENLRAVTTPESKGYVIVYTSGPDYDACMAEQAKESKDCVERVQSLIKSGTVSTLTELNAKLGSAPADDTAA